MAKVKATAGKKSKKLLSKKKIRAGSKVGVPVTPCTGTCCCDAQPSGTIFYCEDGVCVPLTPPDYPAVLVIDPNANNGLPYWGRITNVCPTPSLALGKIRSVVKKK